MKSLFAAAAAASLLGMTMAQASPAQSQRPKLKEQIGNIERIPENEQLKIPTLKEQDALDACHKIDSRTSDGWEWPCGMQRKFDVKLCPPKGDSEAARKDQQTCMCKTGSFFKDADACLDCKVRHALIGDEQDKFYQDVFAMLKDKTYCQDQVVKKSFGDYYQEAVDVVKATKYNGVEPGFKLPTSVERQGHSAHPRDYYSRVGAPEKQGEGNFTQSKEVQNMPTVNKTIVNPIPDPVNAPVMVIVALDGANNTSSSAGPTATPVQPTTLLRVTATNSTGRATPTPSASLTQSILSSVPSSIPADVKPEIITIEGRPCLVYVYFVPVNFHCELSPQGKLSITQQRQEIDWSYGFQLESKKHFDELANIPDACTTGKCEQQITYVKRVKKVSVKGTVEKETVVPGKPQQLPPLEKPTTGSNNPSVPGNGKPAKPVEEVDDGCVEESVTNNTPANNTPKGPSGSPSGNPSSSSPAVPQKDGKGPAAPVTGNTVTKEDTKRPAGPSNGNTGSSGTVPKQDTKRPVSSSGPTGPATGSTATKEDTKRPASSNGPTGPVTGNTVPQKDGKGPASSNKGTGPAGPSNGNTGNTPANNTPQGPSGSPSGNPSSSSPAVPQKDGQGPVSPNGPAGNQPACTTCSAERQDATAVCAEKERLERECEARSGDEKRNCLCGGQFFNNAIKCARRSENCLFGEFEAQALFETKQQYCTGSQAQAKSLNDVLQGVKLAWADRAPGEGLL